jgi:hypothetical protein
MDSTLTAAWIGAVAGFVVWLFSWLWTLWSDRRAKKRIRTMLVLEVEANLKNLQEFCAAVDNKVAFWKNQHLADMQRADALSTIPLPTFSHRIWETLTSSIPVGLDENEIRDVYHFHAQLDELVRLKGIQRDARGHWYDEVNGVINGLLNEGNFLKE